MSELEKSSSPDSPGVRSETSTTPMDASYALDRIQALPDFTFADYLRFVAPLGNEVEINTGIFHIVPMIQSAHESANGNSGLARRHGNLFGFKATDSWKKAGKPVADMPTWEVIGGKRVDIKQEFRAYPTWRESFLDWARLISTLNVYKKAHELLKDKGSVPAGIDAMGLIYATDPAYARKLRVAYERSIQEGIL